MSFLSHVPIHGFRYSLSKKLQTHLLLFQNIPTYTYDIFLFLKFVFIHFVASLRDLILEAIGQYNKSTCIKFIPRTDQSDYVDISPGEWVSNYTFSQCKMEWSEWVKDNWNRYTIKVLPNYQMTRNSYYSRGF